MNDFACSYDVHGVCLHVQVQSVSLGRAAEVVLRPFAASALPEDPHHLVIRLGSVSTDQRPPAGMSHYWSGRLPDGLELDYYAGSDLRQMNLRGLADVRMDFAARCTEITVAPGQEWCVPRGCVFPVLESLLGRSGQFFVHAACLRFDRPGGARAVLIAGSSGAGKTTTALAIAKSGATLLADDACFAVPGRDSKAADLAVWGILLPCKVHERTLAMMPWLSQFEQQKAYRSDEVLVDVRSELGAPDSPNVTPAAIFFLDSRNDKAHRFAPLDRLAAVTRLARENVRAPDPDSRQRAAASFKALTDMVSRCQNYSLSARPNLDSLHGEIASTLGW